MSPADDPSPDDPYHLNEEELKRLLNDDLCEICHGKLDQYGYCQQCEFEEELSDDLYWDF